MRYNFDELTDRRGTGSLKWDVGDGQLPMWVADMDFRTAPEITKVLMEVAGQGIFGYSVVTGDWYDAYGEWWKRRHGFTIQRDWMTFSAGAFRDYFHKEHLFGIKKYDTMGTYRRRTEDIWFGAYVLFQPALSGGIQMRGTPRQRRDEGGTAVSIRQPQRV